MKRTLLLVGGVVQVLIAALHSAMFYGIASSDMPQAIKQTAYLFNGSVLTMVVFFAYVSLLRRGDLIGTPLGRWTCGFTAVLYLQRGVVELIVRGLDPVYLALFLALTALYGFVALAPDRAPAPERRESGC
jgi:hypothetical protein